MATTISSLQSIFRPNFRASSITPSSLMLTFPIGNVSVRRYDVVTSTRNSLPVINKNKCRGIRLRIRAVDEETMASEQPVLVTVSPSELLTMYFQAEGTMSEAAIPSVTKALEKSRKTMVLSVAMRHGFFTKVKESAMGAAGFWVQPRNQFISAGKSWQIALTEGVTKLKVEVLDGIGRVELAKQTTVQATGMASSLIETIQGSGFKLQTLNLSFDDEQEVAEALAL